MTDFIVDPIVDFATSFIDAVGLLGVYPILLALLAGAVWLVIRWRRGPRGDEAAELAA